MGGVRASARRVWSAHGLAPWSIEDLMVPARRWFAGSASEERLAAVLLLAEHAHRRLRAGPYRRR